MSVVYTLGLSVSRSGEVELAIRCAGTVNSREWKTRKWKSWHQNTGPENAREASMESQNVSFTNLVVDHWK